MNRTEHPVLFPVLKNHKIKNPIPYQLCKSNPDPVRIQITGTGASYPLQAPRLASSAAGVRFGSGSGSRRTGTRQVVPRSGLVRSGPPSLLPRSRAASSSSVSPSRARSLSSLSVEFCYGGNSRNCNRIATTFLLQIAINRISSSRTTTTTTTKSSLLIPK
jgi:hypothetical protein